MLKRLRSSEKPKKKEEKNHKIKKKLICVEKIFYFGCDLLPITVMIKKSLCKNGKIVIFALRPSRKLTAAIAAVY